MEDVFAFYMTFFEVGSRCEVYGQKRGIWTWVGKWKGEGNMSRGGL